MMWRPRFWAIAGLLIVLIVATPAFWDKNVDSAPIQVPARVKFLGDAPMWVQDTETVMTELKNWRGQSFLACQPPKHSYCSE